MVDKFLPLIALMAVSCLAAGVFVKGPREVGCDLGLIEKPKIAI